MENLVKHSKNFINLVGKRFNHWEVIDNYTFKSPNGKKSNMLVCRCDCGTIKNVARSNVVNGSSSCCGCIKHKKIENRYWLTKHGKCYTKIYKIWTSMKQRCTNEKSDFRGNYLARGITVCDEWMNSFEAFYKDMGDRPDGMSLDRIDNNKGYSKENCRWANRKEQAINRRTTSIIEYKGDKLSIKDMASKHNIHYYTLLGRIRSGRYSISECIEFGPKRIKKTSRKNI